MSRMSGIRERISWILADIGERHRLSRNMLGDALGCSAPVFRNYINMLSTPSPFFITRLWEMYGVNIEWIYHNKGPPYRGDGNRSHLPEGEAEAPGSAPGADDEPGAPSSRKEAQLERIHRILRSGGRRAAALTMLIDEAYNGLRIENKNKELRKEHARIKDDLDALTKRLEERNPENDD